MKLILSSAFLCLVMLVSPGGMCLADSPPVSIIYVQGGESVITAGPDGTSMIIIQDVIAYYHMLIDNMSYLEPVQTLPDYSCPLQAAVVLSGDENERTSMVVVQNVSLSEDNRTLALQVRPLEFYEGSGLKPFIGDQESLIADTGEKVLNTGLYLEILKSPSNNSDTNACIDECLSRNHRKAVCWRYCGLTPEPDPNK